MSKFSSLAVYQERLSEGYKLLPFKFDVLEGTTYVLSNMVGQHYLLTRDKLAQFVNHTLPSDSEDYLNLKSQHFLIDSESSVANDLLALKLRTKLRRLRDFTSLHIFVVSLRCEHSCPYCQVSRQSDDKIKFDMSQAVADKALEFTFRSPSPAIKIEFQGGEPLLNFTLIKYIVLRAKEINLTEMRNLQFVITTNLALITDEILLFCREHDILISTSLDGPCDLHNRNRPRNGNDSHQRAVHGIEKARHFLGKDRVGALMTTTKASLGRGRDIIDEYLKLGFSGIFLRPLSPYGFAIKTKSYRAYQMDDWMQFYLDGLSYILDLNRKGHLFVEYYTSIILTKMLTPLNPGYVDLMTPAGIGIAVLVYNYDGDVYASDESRMLAEMGDTTFKLGNVLQNSYENIILSDSLLKPLEESFSGSAPMCSECAFEAYCGSEPVFHHATQGDVLGLKPRSSFCKRTMTVSRHLIKLMNEDPEVREIFDRWIGRQ